MTDATTGPGTGAAHTPDGDGSRRSTVTPTTPDRETGPDRESPVGGGDSGHGRTVPPFPTPDEARSESPGTSGTADSPRVTDTTDLEGTGAAGTTNTKTTDRTAGGGSTTHLLPHEESDKLELRLRQAVSGFVDEPRDAVREADQVVEEIAGRFAEAVTRRRRTLRMSWQDGDEGRTKGTQPDTEQLRLALRDYRELAERLLHG